MNSLSKDMRLIFVGLGEMIREVPLQIELTKN
jgi:hypothetical protein